MTTIQSSQEPDDEGTDGGTNEGDDEGGTIGGGLNSIGVLSTLFQPPKCRQVSHCW